MTTPYCSIYSRVQSGFCRLVAVLTVCLASSLSSFAADPLDATAGGTASSLADLIAGSGITVYTGFAPVFVGNANAKGTFVDGMDSIGIDEGVILATGDVGDADGSNDVPDISSCFNEPGDRDIGDWLGDKTLYAGVDAASLEFYFTSSSSSIEIKFVFASDEYLEYVGTGFNDTLIILVNGSNIAKVPSPDTPGDDLIEVNNVNSSENDHVFVDNSTGTFNVEYDGFTTVLTATATVSTTAVNRIKIAIADQADCWFDSAVFIKKDSLRAL